MADHLVLFHSSMVAKCQNKTECRLPITQVHKKVHEDMVYCRPLMAELIQLFSMGSFWHPDNPGPVQEPDQKMLTADL